MPVYPLAPPSPARLGGVAAAGVASRRSARGRAARLGVAVAAAAALLGPGEVLAARCVETRFSAGEARVAGLDCRAHGWGEARPVVLVAGPGWGTGLFRWSDGGGLAPELADLAGRAWVVAPSAIVEGEPPDDPWDALLAGVPDATSRATSGGRVPVLVGQGLAGTALYWTDPAGGGDDPAPLVTLGAPLDWERPSRLLLALGQALDESPPGEGWMGLLSRPAPFGGGERFFDLLLHSLPRGRARALVERARAAAVPLPPAVSRVLGRWVREGLEPPDGIPIRRHLEEDRRPLLAIAGALDRLAPSEEVAAASRAAGARGTAYRAGFMNRDGRDAGHLDLLLTPRASRRVATLIHRFTRGKKP